MGSDLSKRLSTRLDTDLATGLAGGGVEESPFASFGADFHWDSGFSDSAGAVWTDRIGGYTLSRTGTPTYNATGSGPSGGASISFSGSGQYYTGATALAELLDGGEFWQLVSFRTPGSVGALNYAVGFGNLASTVEYGRIHLSASDVIVARYRSGTPNRTINGTGTVFANTSYWASSGNTGTTFYLNSSVDSESTGDSTGISFTATDYAIGANPTSAMQAFTGDIREVVGFTSLPNSSTRAAVESLINDRR